jgi:hypothetical protein
MKAWQAVRKVADAHESRFRRVVEEAASVGQASLNAEAVAEGFERNTPSIVSAALHEAVGVMGTVLAVELIRELSSTMEAAAKTALRTAKIAGSLRAAREAPIEGLFFDLTNPEAVLWIQQHGGDLIVGITKTTQAAIQRILIRSFEEGIPTGEAARMIRPLIGLTDVHTDAVFNLRRAILGYRDRVTGRMVGGPGSKLWAGKTPIRVPRGGATADFVARRTQQYAARLLNLRARMIARTETMSASNEGQRQLWLQAREQGLIGAGQTKEWIVTPDDRLCQICAPLSGEVQLVDEEFSVGVLSPPAHVMCRCAMGLSDKRAPRKVA